MKALVYHGNGGKVLGQRAGRDDRATHRCGGAGRRDHDLRDRPAHPQGRRRCDTRQGCWATKQLAPWSRSARAYSASRWATAYWFPASRPAGCAGTAATVPSASAWVAVAGSSATRIDGTQAEYVRCHSPTIPPHPIPEGVSDEQMILLADILPTAYEVGVLNGALRPARCGRHRGRRANRAGNRLGGETAESQPCRRNRSCGRATRHRAQDRRRHHHQPCQPGPGGGDRRVSPTVWAPMSRWKPWAFPRLSTWRWPWFGPAGTLPTSVSTVRR